MSEKSVERRHHKRFVVQAGAIVAFKKFKILNFGKTDFIRLGPVIDISRGGLAAHYIENRRRIKPHKKLSILSNDGTPKFEDLEFTTILDEKIAELPNSKIIRRRSVKFGKMSGFQMARLENFIKTLDFTGAGLATHEGQNIILDKSSSEFDNGKTKFSIQSDILEKFKSAAAKNGEILEPGWLASSYCPSLGKDFQKTFNEAMDELIFQGILEYVEDPDPNYMLTIKGEELIYNKKEFS